MVTFWTALLQFQTFFQHSPLLLSEEVRDSLGKKGMLCDQSETENAYILDYNLNSVFLLTEIPSVAFPAKFIMF